MSLPQSVAEVIEKHVTLEVECIDRMYLNVYVPALQHEGGVVSFFRFHRGQTFASSALMDPISKAFLRQIATFCKEHDIPVISFEKKQRKDDVAAEHLATFTRKEGVLFVGKAQEKTPRFINSWRSRTGSVRMVSGIGPAHVVSSRKPFSWDRARDMETTSAMSW